VVCPPTLSAADNRTSEGTTILCRRTGALLRFCFVVVLSGFDWLWHIASFMNLMIQTFSPTRMCDIERRYLNVSGSKTNFGRVFFCMTEKSRRSSVKMVLHFSFSTSSNKVMSASCGRRVWNRF
jgi:hypothetical protein